MAKRKRSETREAAESHQQSKKIRKGDPSGIQSCRSAQTGDIPNSKSSRQPAGNQSSNAIVPAASSMNPSEYLAEKLPAQKKRRRKKRGRKTLEKAPKKNSSIGSDAANGKQGAEMVGHGDLQSQVEAFAGKESEGFAREEKSSTYRKRKRQKGRKPGAEPPFKVSAYEDRSWRIAEPIGGRMLDVDPIFSSDEEYLLVAYYTYVAIYSTSTSLMARKLRLAERGVIAAITLCPSKYEQLFVATTSGRIELWDWLEGRKLTTWRVRGRPQSLTSTQRSEDQGNGDFVYFTNRISDDAWELALLGAESHGGLQSHTLFTQQQPMSSVRALDHGKVIVMTSGPCLTIGTSSISPLSKPSDLKYTWRRISCPEWIASLDIRVRHDSQQKQKPKVAEVDTSVDIVIGGLKGSIQIYEDFLKRLVILEKISQKGQSQELTSRRLHWHRNPVLTVKWSADGNYLISGGQETVLVLWQLDSGRKETLPHLGAPIESLVVSPGGSSYGIRLADNSAMILSTSEMRPSFNTAGIQITGRGPLHNPLPLLPSVDSMDQTSIPSFKLSPPVCVSPSRAGQLLLAVPPQTSSKLTGSQSQNASYLQTFDIGSAHQISRQALTRTKITNLNMGPESNTIEEPNVTQIATTHDGQWLATVDEWMPPRRDLTSLAFDQEREREEQVFRQEIYLKFWSWNDDTKYWELVSRIDNPHASDSGNAYQGGRVLALAANPSSVGFATFGEDGLLKTWRSTIRRRNGLEVKGKGGKALSSWHCYRSTSVEPSSLIAAKGKRLNAHIAYSFDGSVIAAGLQSPSPSAVYLINSYAGEIESTQTGLYTGPLLGLAILDRYLVILSHELIVWDLVDDKIHYGIDLQLPPLSLAKLTAFSHLAIDVQHNTFAVAKPEINSAKHGTKTRSQIAIFDPSESEPLFIDTLPNTLTTLLSAPGRKGYYAIDSAAEIRTLTPSQPVPAESMELPKIEVGPQRGLNGIFGNADQRRRGKLGLSTQETKNITREPNADGEDAVVINSDKLAQIFDQAPAYALPPVSELFEQVAGLCVGRQVAMTAASS